MLEKQRHALSELVGAANHVWRNQPQNLLILLVMWI
jgi:hypothetical protein